MTLADFLTKLSHALRQEEPADYDQYNAERRREERENTTLNLQKAEVGERRTDRQEDSRYRKRTLRLGYATFLVSFITMGAVIYYACIAAQQRDAMVEANKHAYRALYVQQRAYVNVHDVRFGHPLTAGEWPELIVTYKNSGLTPARGLWIQPIIKSYTDEMLKRPEVQADLFPVMGKDCVRIKDGEILPPNVSRTVNTLNAFGRPAQWFLSYPREHIVEIAANIRRFRVNVFVHYVDEFGGCHMSLEPFEFNTAQRIFVPAFLGFQIKDFEK